MAARLQVIVDLPTPPFWLKTTRRIVAPCRAKAPLCTAAARLLGRDRRRPVDRHGSDAVLRRAFDQAVGVGEVDEGVALLVDDANDAQLLEQDRQALVEHLLLLRQRLRERDRADLAAGDRRFGLVLGEAERTRDAAGLGARH